jgi:BirA family biotin operon repressor/biotin-[acetyl-CoA-carboxylase] ligase
VTASPGDLTAEAVAEALPGRAVRAFPALLSTDAEAAAWARAGAPSGAVVVADYQASPRGRGGLPWQVRPGEGLGFSLVLRPELPLAREGWLYSATGAAICRVAGAGARFSWPDLVHADGVRFAAWGVATTAAGDQVAGAVLTVLVEPARPPRAPLLAALLAAIEERATADPDELLADLQPRCVTLGERVTARLVPMGPAGVTVTGEAVGLRADGALALRDDVGRFVAVLPQHLGALDPVAEDRAQVGARCPVDPDLASGDGHSGERLRLVGSGPVMSRPGSA